MTTELKTGITLQISCLQTVSLNFAADLILIDEIQMKQPDAVDQALRLPAILSKFYHTWRQSVDRSITRMIFFAGAHRPSAAARKASGADQPTR